MKLSQKEIQHLYWRAGFGCRYSALSGKLNKSKKQLVNELFTSSHTYNELSTKTNKLASKDRGELTREDKKQMRRMSRNNILKLNVDWIDAMATSDSFLREKMALFWHNHFACSSNADVFVESYLETIRKNALGNFKNLLLGVSKEPIMLKYLDNDRNRKKHPNENFAREVMELFTLGRGQGYTETDIQEAARAFTGWGCSKEGQFEFNERKHDYDEKTIFGKTGNFEGEDVLNMLLEKEQCALYLSQKLYRYVVNPTIDNNRVKDIAGVLYNSGYNVSKCLKYIFNSDWFYKPENIGVKIKSPVELLAGIQKSLYIKITDPGTTVYVQSTLGQKLFYPPNVAGWAEGKSWIDSSTLLFRTNLAEYLMKSSDVDFTAKDSGDENDQLNIARITRKLETTIDIDTLKKDLKKLDTQDGYEGLINFLLQVPVRKINGSETNSEMIPLLIEITRTPEYQLC